MARRFAVLGYVKSGVRVFLRKRNEKRKEIKNAIRSRIRIILKK